MQKRVALTTITILIYLLAARPALAAQEESVFLPGWFAWLMVVLALVLPAALFIYLRSKGRL